jgi:hypothetical protein
LCVIFSFLFCSFALLLSWICIWFGSFLKI